MLIDVCSWDDPGRDRYQGTTVEAISRYSEIPSAERAALIKAIEAKNYVDLVVITKGEIRGITDRVYAPEITNMQFGNKGKVCKQVTRDKWPAGHIERAMVFESENFTIIMPSSCSNFSIIKKIKGPLPMRDPKHDGKPGKGHGHGHGHGNGGPINKVPEPWTFPAILAYAAYFTFKRKNA